MSRFESVEEKLSACVRRLDVLLNPWGFEFQADVSRDSHCGPFASGHYVRGTTRIGLSCRETIDNIYYEHAFVTEHRWSRAIERFDVTHPDLMNSLGHSDDCELIGSNNPPDAIIARTGGDRVAALLRDLSEFAAPILARPNQKFDEIIRSGRRCYFVESKE